MPSLTPSVCQAVLLGLPLLLLPISAKKHMTKEMAKEITTVIYTINRGKDRLGEQLFVFQVDHPSGLRLTQKGCSVVLEKHSDSWVLPLRYPSTSLDSREPTSYNTGGSGTGRNGRPTPFFPFGGRGSRVGGPVPGSLGLGLRLGWASLGCCRSAA